MKAFKAYDIRGVYGQDFNRDDVYRIGWCLPRLLQADCVLVGRDARESSDEIFAALTNGIRDNGADVVDIGRGILDAPLLDLRFDVAGQAQP